MDSVGPWQLRGKVGTVVGKLGDPRLRYWVPTLAFSVFLTDRIKKLNNGMHDIDEILRGDKAGASEPGLPCMLAINRR